MYSNTTNILSIIVILSIIIILAIITGTVLAVIIGALSVGLVLRFITSTTNICYTYKVRDSNVEVNIYAIRNGRIIGYILAVDTLYGFINIK